MHRYIRDRSQRLGIGIKPGGKDSDQNRRYDADDPDKDQAKDARCDSTTRVLRWHAAYHATARRTCTPSLAHGSSFFQHTHGRSGKGEEVADATKSQRPEYPLPAPEGSRQRWQGEVKDCQTNNIVKDEVADKPAQKLSTLKFLAATKTQSPDKEDGHNNKRPNEC